METHGARSFPTRLYLSSLKLQVSLAFLEYRGAACEGNTDQSLFANAREDVYARCPPRDGTQEPRRALRGPAGVPVSVGCLP